MATSSFDKVFVVRKKADRKRLTKIISSKKTIPEYKLPIYSEQDNWKKNEAILLECFSNSGT